MGVWYDYFRAADAATTVRLMEATGGLILDDDGRSLVGDLVQTKHTDPMVVVGQLVAFIHGVPWTSDLTGDRLVWPVGAESDEEYEGPWVVEIGDAARDALAGVSDADRPGHAARWAEIDEFDGRGNPDFLLTVLAELAALARRARAADERLFCSMCV